MVAVDTNILIRLLVDDPGAVDQVKIARETVRAADQVYVPQIVQVECIWVLQRVYEFDKANIIARLTELACNLCYVLQYPDNFLMALNIFKNSAADFADCLILVESRARGCELLTFHRKLAKQAGVQLLSILES
jgi:predicted nucleic-acid-binding protein